MPVAYFSHPQITSLPSAHRSNFSKPSPSRGSHTLNPWSSQVLHCLPADIIYYHGRQWDMVKMNAWRPCSICQCELSSNSTPLVVVVSEWPTLKKSLKPLEQKALEGLRLLKATSGLSNMHTNNIITAEWFGERVYFVVVAVTFYS